MLAPVLANDAIVIPLAGMLLALFGMLLPIAIVLAVLHYRHKRTQQLYDTVKYLADKGQPIPSELLDPPQLDRPRESPQFRAITALGVGVGLAAMFYLLNLRFLVGIGALLVCIGVAQLIAVRLEKR
jgi:hypothetical protein